jgi:hypothetical protein
MRPRLRWLDAFFCFGSKYHSERLINLTNNSHMACISLYVRGKDLKSDVA